MTRICQFIIVIAMLTGPVTAQTDTTFTYQGELKESGEPASGSFDMDFSLWDALSGGSQVGSAIQFIGQAVSDGLFTVELDFGADVFDGSRLWLEITVEGNTLAPRQPITGSPYSIQTRGIFVDADNNVGIGTTAPTRNVEIAAEEAILRLTSDDNSLATVSRLELKTVDTYGVYTPLGTLSFLSADDTAWCSISGVLAAGSTGAMYLSVPPDNSYPQIGILGDGNVEFGRAASIGAADGADSHFQLEGGNFGIGTSSPVFPLEVHNNGSTGKTLRLVSDRSLGYMQFAEGSTPRAYLGYGDAGDLLVNALPDSFAIDGLSSALHFAVDSDATRGITVDTNGNVGIGGTDIPDQSSLYVLNTGSEPGATAVWGVVTDAGDGVSYGGHFIAYRRDCMAVRGEAFGDYGRGVEGDAYGVEGHGVSGYANGGENAIAVYGYGFNCWDFFAGGPGGHYGEISSIRWKSNIRNIDQPLDKISRLRGVYFDWDAEHGGQHDVGMIAEEVGVVLPEIVTYEENGVDANGMDYGKLTPLLVEAINALRAEKDAEIAELKQRLSDLEQLIGQLTSEGRGRPK